MDPEVIQHSSQLISGHGWPWWVLALAAAAGFLLLGQAYRWLITPAPRGARLALLALRFTWVALLLWCLWDPQREIKSTKRQGQFPEVITAIDASQSMAMPGANTPNAWPSVLKTARDLETVLPPEIKPNARWFTLGSSLRPWQNAAPAAPEDEQSRLGLQLTELAHAAPQSGQGSALFLLTDGQDTAASSRQAAQLTRELRARNIRVFPILPGDPPQPVQFVRLGGLEMPSSVAANAVFNLNARWSCVLRSPAEYDLEITEASSGQVLAKRPLKLSGAAQGQESFTVKAAAPGLLRINARLLPKDGRPGGEPVSGATAVVKRTGGKILLVQGSLDWEFRFVRKALSENPSLTMDALVRLNDTHFMLQRTGTEAVTQRGDAINILEAQASKYDVVVLANVNPGLLTQGAQNELLRLVREGGGGVLFVSGNGAQSSAFRSTLLEELLPVTLEQYTDKLRAEDDFARTFRENVFRSGSMSGNERRFVNSVQSSGQDKIYKDLVAMNLTADGQVSEIWRDASSAKAPTPPPTFINSAKALKAKPGATILAQHPTETTSQGQPRPLMAIQRVGAGRSAFIGVDNLWRWRMEAASEAREYDRFWQQLLLWLAQGAAGTALNADQFQYRPGDTAKLAFSARGLPGGSAAPILRVTDPAGQATEAAIQWSQAEALGRSGFTLKEVGAYRVELLSGDRVLAATSLTADTREVEREFSGINLPWLRGIAEATGGQVLQANNLKLIPDLLAGTRQTVTESSRHSLWRLNWIFLLILGLYLVELCVRRRFLLT